MRTKLVSVCILVAVVSAGCVEKPIGQDKDEIAIKEFIVSYYKTMSDRDWESYRTYFISKATLSTIWDADADSIPEVVSYSIDEFLSQTDQGPDSQPVFEEKPLSVEIDARNDLAAVWVKYEARFGNEKEMMSWQGYDLFSLIRLEGQWKITSLAYVSD